MTRKNLHTTAEAAAILRVKQSWLEKQAAARRIPFTMLGGAYRFTDDHLDQIVCLNEKVPGSERHNNRHRGERARRLQTTTAQSVAPLLKPRPRPAPKRRTTANDAA